MQPEPNVNQLISDSLRHNKQAQHKLYRLYADAMLNTCYRLLNHVEEAEDVLQEGFVAAFMQLKTFKGNSSFGSWLKRIMVNKCLDRLKQQQLKIVDEPYDDFESEEPSEADMEFTVAAIKEALRALPEGQRVIFSLYFLEGYDHEEISGILDITKAGSKSQLSKARARVRQFVKKSSQKKNA